MAIVIGERCETSSEIGRLQPAAILVEKFSRLAATPPATGKTIEDLNFANSDNSLQEYCTQIAQLLKSEGPGTITTEGDNWTTRHSISLSSCRTDLELFDDGYIYFIEMDYAVGQDGKVTPKKLTLAKQVRNPAGGTNTEFRGSITCGNFGYCEVTLAATTSTTFNTDALGCVINLATPHQAENESQIPTQPSRAHRHAS